MASEVVLFSVLAKIKLCLNQLGRDPKCSWTGGCVDGHPSCLGSEEPRGNMFYDISETLDKLIAKCLRWGPHLMQTN